MYKYDLHVHTSDISRCAKRTSEEIMYDYAELGFTGVVITDHFSVGYLDSYGDIPWKERIDCQLAGYYRAKEIGEKLGVDVFLGIELRVPVKPKVEVLIYGLDVEFLKKNEGIQNLSPNKLFHLLANKNDMAIFQAHPFRAGGELIDNRYVHGIEMINGGQPEEVNALACNYALKHKIPVIACSDNHNFGADKCGIYTNEKIRSEKHLAKVLLENNYSIFCGLPYKEENPIWQHSKVLKTERQFSKFNPSRPRCNINE
ncbi:PHP domain-containing protein [Vallitalea okinawensis]|uniref:PHP domain-containing protein n=1 Tax=Vallitalea okinawensis TaxID=2078660 RepID=UPI000CFE2582|nr:PHP domain-containing protein [Vallitalea okinawensis]